MLSSHMHQEQDHKWELNVSVFLNDDQSARKRHLKVGLFNMLNINRCEQVFLKITQLFC